ncbi:11059_t:CDS:2, partial [Acaulospora colombiana]
MYFVSYTLPSMSSQGTCSSPGSPDLAVPRADQEAFNFDSDDDYSEIYEAISNSDSCVSDTFLSEILPELRRIEGSSRLFSAQNPLYPLPLDQEEDKQHAALRLGLWGLPGLRTMVDGALTRDPGVPKAVLDIATTKIYEGVVLTFFQRALDMVAEYDNLHVDAIDVSSQITAHLPPNV